MVGSLGLNTQQNIYHYNVAHLLTVGNGYQRVDGPWPVKVKVKVKVHLHCCSVSSLYIAYAYLPTDDGEL